MNKDNNSASRARGEGILATDTIFHWPCKSEVLRNKYDDEELQPLKTTKKCNFITGFRYIKVLFHIHCTITGSKKIVRYTEDFVIYTVEVRYIKGPLYYLPAHC